MENNNLVEVEVKENFFKKYAYYFVMAGMVLVFAVVIGLTTKSGEALPQGEVEVNTTAITFASPVSSGAISKGYSATELQYDNILKEWSIHKSLDYKVSEGATVLACYDGVIEDVSTNIIDGTIITINHGNNLKTKYKLLDENISVKLGDSVKKGDVIGKAQSNLGNETDATEIKFEVWKDNQLVDPAGYLDIESK